MSLSDWLLWSVILVQTAFIYMLAKLIVNFLNKYQSQVAKIIADNTESEKSKRENIS